MRRIMFDVKQCMPPKGVMQIITHDKGYPERLIFRRPYRVFGRERLTFSPLRVNCLHDVSGYGSFGCQFLSHAYDG